LQVYLVINTKVPLISDYYLGEKGKPGDPGKLLVEVFNLLRSTVQKFELPAHDGSSTFIVGGKRSTHLNIF